MKTRTTIKVFCGNEIMVSLDRGRFTTGWAQTSWQKCKDTNWETIRQWVVVKKSNKLLATRAINKHEATWATKCLWLGPGWSEPVNVCFKSATEFRRRVILQLLQTGRVTLTAFHRFALPGIAGLYCHNDGQCTIENSIGQPHSQLDWRPYFVHRCAAPSAWLQKEDWYWQSHSAVILSITLSGFREMCEKN